MQSYDSEGLTCLDRRFLSLTWNVCLCVIPYNIHHISYDWHRCKGDKESLEKPLGGMGTAFSSSLFGLGGSLILGFLDLQSGQAQNRFYNMI